MSFFGTTDLHLISRRSFRSRLPRQSSRKRCPELHVCAHSYSFIWLWNWPRQMYLKHAEARLEFVAIKIQISFSDLYPLSTHSVSRFLSLSHFLVTPLPILFLQFYRSFQSASIPPRFPPKSIFQTGSRALHADLNIICRHGTIAAIAF